jgi:hypothetical protein
MLNYSGSLTHSSFPGIIVLIGTVKFTFNVTLSTFVSDELNSNPVFISNPGGFDLLRYNNNKVTFRLPEDTPIDLFRSVKFTRSLAQWAR